MNEYFGFLYIKRNKRYLMFYIIKTSIFIFVSIDFVYYKRTTINIHIIPIPSYNNIIYTTINNKMKIKEYFMYITIYSIDGIIVGYYWYNLGFYRRSFVMNKIN